jgi:hypothetical protein
LRFGGKGKREFDRRRDVQLAFADPTALSDRTS